MRVLTLAAPVLFLLAAACAPTANSNSGDTELEQLAAECTARGGILQATGSQTGRPQLDNTCRITGASRLPPSN